MNTTNILELPNVLETIVASLDVSTRLSIASTCRRNRHIVMSRPECWPDLTLREAWQRNPDFELFLAKVAEFPRLLWLPRVSIETAEKLPVMKNVKSLTIFHFVNRSTSGTMEVFDPLSRAFPALEKLCIDRKPVHGWTNWRSFLSSFPKLKHVIFGPQVSINPPVYHENDANLDGVFERYRGFTGWYEHKHDPGPRFLCPREFYLQPVPSLLLVHLACHGDLSDTLADGIRFLKNLKILEMGTKVASLDAMKTRERSGRFLEGVAELRNLECLVLDLLPCTQGMLMHFLKAAYSRLKCFGIRTELALTDSLIFRLAEKMHNLETLWIHHAFSAHFTTYAVGAVLSLGRLEYLSVQCKDSRTVTAPGMNFDSALWFPALLRRSHALSASLKFLSISMAPKLTVEETQTFFSLKERLSRNQGCLVTTCSKVEGYDPKIEPRGILEKIRLLTGAKFDRSVYDLLTYPQDVFTEEYYQHVF